MPLLTVGRLPIEGAEVMARISAITTIIARILVHSAESTIDNLPHSIPRTTERRRQLDQ
jgi:hypothetical protein